MIGLRFIKRHWLLIAFLMLPVTIILLPTETHLSPISLERVAPMKKLEQQCLLCGRTRDSKWLCKMKVQDRIEANDISDWIDAVSPDQNQHRWLTATDYVRTEWFGPKSIGCGGTPILSSIYRRRNEMGEAAAVELLMRFQDLVRSAPNGIPDFGQIDEFERQQVFGGKLPGE